MNFEKLMNSKINVVADWIIRIVMINILVILCALPIITLFPALVAGYNVFSDYVDRKEVRLFPAFFDYFRNHIGKKIGFGVLILLIAYISFTNSSYYSTVLETSPSAFFMIGYYVTLVILALIYAMMLYTFVLFYEFPELKLGRIMKLSFFLAGKYYFITIFLVLVNAIPVLMLFTPVTSVLFVFMGVSIPLLIQAILTKPARIFIKHLGAKS